MRLDGTALRLTIIVSEAHQWRHRPVYTEIIHRAHKAGLAGATALHGIEGYGASSRIHANRIFGLSQHLPVLITIIDTHERIDAFLPELDELVPGGVVILDDCDVIRYVAGGESDAADHHHRGQRR